MSILEVDVYQIHDSPNFRPLSNMACLDSDSDNTYLPQRLQIYLIERTLIVMH